MDIDSILTPTTPTATQVKAAFLAAFAMAEAIRTLGQVPSGHLYAQVNSQMDMSTYNRIIATLKNAGLVSESAYLLTWTGPTLEEK